MENKFKFKTVYKKRRKYYDDKVPVPKRKFIKRAKYGPSNKVVADFP